MFKYWLILISILFFVDTSAQSPEYKNNGPKIGLVLSGGSAKGIAHVGVLKVLEEAGIVPDYVGGTSMGSIVGALYAAGYSVDSIEKIALTTDWMYMIGDEISRIDLALEEKDDADRFFISFPVKGTGIQIPSGVINGQNIQNRLNTLFSHVYNISNFDQLSIPFLCNATDIETGEEVVFRDGYLPEVLRASISIPSIFNPVEIDGRLLVDGGLVNNFPVDRVREMGADIIIGVDVGFRYYKKDELNSILKILEQSVFFYGEESNTRNKQLCDILISPEFGTYGGYSFNSPDTLISIGEAAARKFLPELRALADSIHLNKDTISRERNFNNLDSLYLSEIGIRGLSRVSEKLVRGKLQLNEEQWVKPDEIERAIQRLYSSLYFEKVTYKLVERDDGAGLIIDAEEAEGGEFRLGVHYDTNYRSAILLNATFRNLLIDGSKLSSSLALGENPYFEATFFKNNGWKPGFGINFKSSKLGAFVYQDGRKISSLAYSESKVQLFTQTVFSNSYALGAGLEYENVILRAKVDPLIGVDKMSEDFINYYGFIKMDSYDNAYYPKKGLKIDSQLKFITSDDQEAILFYVGRYSQAHRISRKLTFINHLYIGATDGDSIPYQYNFYTGGLNPTLRNGLLPFVGLDYMEVTDKNALIWAGDIQFQLFQNIYAIGKLNIGNLKSTIRDLFTIDDMIGGYGMTVGYNSFIGPIEISLQKNAKTSQFLGFINIGFWF